MATSDYTRESRFRVVEFIDATDRTEILIDRPTLELKLRDLENAGAAAKYEDVIPWVVSALTLVASAIPLYISSQDSWARALAFAMAACALVPATIAVQGWRKPVLIEKNQT